MAPPARRRFAPSWRHRSTRFGVRPGGRPPCTSCWSATTRPRTSTSATRSARAARPASASPSTACRRRVALDAVLALVRQLNGDAACDGILVQSPLPAAMGKHAAQQVFDAIDPAKDVDGFHPAQRRPARAGPGGARAVHAVGRHRAARARADRDRRPPRRRHRPQRDRRQADGAAAAAARRDGHDLSLEDAGSCRRCRARADILVAAIGRPGFVTPRLRQARRRGRRRRHQPRRPIASSAVGLFGAGQSAARGLRQEGINASSATCTRRR